MPTARAKKKHASQATVGEIAECRTTSSTENVRRMFDLISVFGAAFRIIFIQTS